MVDRLRVDIVSALRSLKAAPAIPIAAVLTTSLAVAMNLAMAGLIDRALISPPAHVLDPERVFTVGFEVETPSGERSVGATASYLTFEAVQTRAPAVIPAAWHYVSPNINVGNRRVAVKAMAVTGGYFSMLGARAQLGRTVLPDDDRPPVGAPVVVLSHSRWRRDFGADPRAVGGHIEFGGQMLQIVGVMPAGFGGHTAERIDLWMPLSTAMHYMPGWHTQPRLAVIEIGVRMAPGYNAAAVKSQLAAATGASVVLFSLVGADVAPAPYRIAMWLTGVSLVVLAAGLANGATLFVVRGCRRRREFSIKTAMGATRARLLRQLVVESTIVASVATIVALIFASWFDELVRSVLFPTLVEQSGWQRAVALAAVTGGVSTLVVAVGAGALQLPAAVTAEDLAARPGRVRRRVARGELLVLQTMLAVMMITGAGMFAQSYLRMAAEEHELTLTNVLMVTFDDGPATVRDQDQLLASAVDRLRKLPGVETATVFAALPLGGRRTMVPAIAVPGVGEPRVDGRLPSMIESTPELFDILGIDIVQGRPLTAGDDRGAPVVVVSETMAREVWRGSDALGKCIRIGFDPTSTDPSGLPASAPCREVVGIARDRRPRPALGRGERRTMHYYVPFAQGLAPPPRAEGLLVRQAPGGDVPLEAIRREVASGRSDLPFIDVRPYQALDGSRLALWLIGTKLLLIFGGLALATAALGICAAFTHSVTERRHEIAVRLAVGASRRRVFMMVVYESLTVAAKGAINGVVVATVVGWVARSIIFGLSSPGLLVIVVTTLAAVTVAIGAAWLPALSASRANPGTLLRVD